MLCEITFANVMLIFVDQQEPVAQLISEAEKTKCGEHLRERIYKSRLEGM